MKKLDEIWNWLSGKKMRIATVLYFTAHMLTLLVDIDQKWIEALLYTADILAGVGMVHGGIKARIESKGM